MGVEAAVTTCRICSRADSPPPTWKATWSALFCWGKSRERGREWNRGTVREQWATSWTGGLHGSHQRGNLSYSYRRGIEIWNKVIPKVFLFNLKSVQPNSASQQSSFSGRQMLCRLQLAPGWSQQMTADWSETEKLPLGKTKNGSIRKLQREGTNSNKIGCRDTWDS